LFDFRHADVSLRQVVVEGNIKVMEKSQDILMIVTEALEEIAGFGLFYPALSFFRRNYDWIRGQPSFDQVISLFRTEALTLTTMICLVLSLVPELFSFVGRS
jgi:hypothetical protein